MMEMVRNLRDQLPNMPTSDDVLHSVGLQYERNAMTAFNTLTAFAIGAITGAVLATLFAPKSGQEVRQDLNERVRAFGDRMGWSDRRAEGGETAAH